MNPIMPPRARSRAALPLGRPIMAVVAFVLLLLPTDHSTAQQYDWQKCADCFEGYNTDIYSNRVFTIGGEMPYHPDSVMNHFHMTFGYYYGGFDNLWTLSDSSRWVPDSINAADRWRQRVDWNLYKRAADRGFKMNYLPYDLYSLGFSLYSVINPYGRTSLKSNHPDTPDVDVGNFLRVTSVPTDKRDTVVENFIYSGQFNKISPSSDTLIVGHPRFVSHGMRASNPAYYNILGYADSSVFFDLKITVNTSTTADEFINLGNNDAIAYAILYGRDTTSQTNDNCRCAFYTPFDTVFITKNLYLAANKPYDSATMGKSNINYREIVFPINFFRDSIYLRRPVTKQTGSVIDTIGWLDSVPRYFAPLNITDSESFGFNWDCDSATCAVKLAQLKTDNRVPPSTLIPDGRYIEGSDFWFQIFSTRKVDLTFLRTKVASHLVRVADRGDLDSLINEPFTAMLNDTSYGSALTDIFERIATPDETNYFEHEASRIFASRAQDLLLGQTTAFKAGALVNSYHQYNTIRAFTGDYDSTRRKMIGTFLSHVYPITGGVVPITYANPLKMDGGVNNPYYKDLWLTSTLTSHKRYHDSILKGIERKKANTCEAIDIARYRYIHLAPPHRVINNIQSSGYFVYNSGDGYAAQTFQYGGNWRPITPEEIHAQCWLSMACNVDGISFADLTYDGLNIGIFNQNDGSHHLDYDTLQVPTSITDPFFRDSIFRVPKMWLGMNQRFNAIKKVTDEFSLIDSVYQQLPFDPKHQISVDKTDGDFSNIPILDTIFTRRAKRYTLPTTVPVGKAYTDSTADSVNHTFFELSYLAPKTGTTEDLNGTRYLILANKLTWPVDYDLTYHDGNIGLGAIDVRKPVLKLRNISGIVADSFIVELVGHESQWRDTASFSDTVALNWIEPGWGGMYRVIPIPRAISPFGAAYNNAVHSENLSNDSTERERFIVYERDSVVYLRSIDTNGAISREWRLSDANDETLNGGGFRPAVNYHPAIASTRNGKALMAVWERRAGTKSAVIACRIDSLPTPTTATASLKRLSVSTSTILPSGIFYFPSVTGVDSGWVVAWGTTGGTTLVAVRDTTNPSVANHVSSTITVKATTINDNGLVPMDPTTQYPTLAHRPARRLIDSGRVRQAVHLAYQQLLQGSTNWRIIYNLLGASFPVGSNPVITAWPNNEHVSANIPGCNFIHPSIACDSILIGVAFERVNTPNGNQVLLRFRDTLLQRNPVLGRWMTSVYLWGTTKENFERPSLTQFPRADSLLLQILPNGGLVWHRTDAPDGTRNEQLLYRFRALQPTAVNDGQHPSMTLVPYKRVNPFASSGLFYRRDDSARLSASRIEGGQAWYYPAAIDNTPFNESTAFSENPGGTAIIAMGIVQTRFSTSNSCTLTPFKNPFHFGIVDSGGIINPGFPPPPLPPTVPGLPPSFFPPTNGSSVVDSIDVVDRITRTSVFDAGSSPVNITVRIGATDSLLFWLNTFPYDSTLQRLADVLLLLELVRTSDSTIIWRHDTLSARDLNSDTVETNVSVPVHTAAAPGTDVFVRMRAVPTFAVETDISAAFHFTRRDTANNRFFRIARPETTRQTATGAASLRLAIVPNPASDQTDIRITGADRGRVRLKLFDMLGNALGSPIETEISHAGDYSYRLDTRTLETGTYLVVVESNNQRATAQLSIIGN